MSSPSRAVFLSYASEDAPAAQRIAERLRAAGIEVWFDREELRGGDAWDRQICERIHDCRLFIAVTAASRSLPTRKHQARVQSNSLDRGGCHGSRGRSRLPRIRASCAEARRAECGCTCNRSFDRHVQPAAAFHRGVAIREHERGQKSRNISPTDSRRSC